MMICQGTRNGCDMIASRTYCLYCLLLARACGLGACRWPAGSKLECKLKNLCPPHEGEINSRYMVKSFPKEKWEVD